jgi:hypothetical protein
MNLSNRAKARRAGLNYDTVRNRAKRLGITFDESLEMGYRPPGHNGGRRPDPDSFTSRCLAHGFYPQTIAQRMKVYRCSLEEAIALGQYDTPDHYGAGHSVVCSPDTTSTAD